MSTCTRCGQSFGPTVGAYCPSCGAPLAPEQRPDSQWANRIGGGASGPNWLLSLIWIPLAPLAVLAYPFILTRRCGWLTRHIESRFSSVVLVSPRFAQSPEGQTIVARYRRGAPMASAIIPSVLSLLFLIAAAGVLFIAPARAPSPINYEDAFEGLVTGSAAMHYVYMDSAESYERWWRSGNQGKFFLILVRPYSEGRMTLAEANQRYPGLGVWDQPPIDSPKNHRPYYYYRPDSASGGKLVEVYHSAGIWVYWNGIRSLTAVFYLSLAAWYLMLMWAGLAFWTRLLKHASTEALAAGYAMANPAYHDQLIQGNSSFKSVWGILGIVASVTSLQLVFFPLMSALAFKHHLAWERQYGVGALLETGAWPQQAIQS